MVWLFGSDVAGLRPVDRRDSTPPAVAALGRVVLAGARSTRGPEAFYALGRSTSDASDPEPPPCSPGPVVFLAVDDDGQPRPGAWSYGQSVGLRVYGAPPPAPVELAPDLAPISAAR